MLLNSLVSWDNHAKLSSFLHHLEDLKGILPEVVPPSLESLEALGSFKRPGYPSNLALYFLKQSYSKHKSYTSLGSLLTIKATTF